MTIKKIKEIWSKEERYCGIPGKKMFTVYTFGAPIGKSVIMVVHDPDMGRYVEAIIPIATGKDILNGHSRPCDNMDDAVDVACEMIQDNWDDLSIDL